MPVTGEIEMVPGIDGSLDHAPPAEASLNVIGDPAHTDVPGAIITSGRGFTVTVVLAKQPVGNTKNTVSSPPGVVGGPGMVPITVAVVIAVINVSEKCLDVVQ